MHCSRRLMGAADRVSRPMNGDAVGAEAHQQPPGAGLRERFAIIAPGHWLSLAVLFPIERPRFIAVSPLQSIRRCVVVESGILRLSDFWPGAQTTVPAMFKVST